MGTMLQSLGLPVGAAPDSWNIDNPTAVKQVHEAYLTAGAQMILTNTFGCNAKRIRHGTYSAAELAQAGVRIAREAVKQAGRTDCMVALDIGPLGVFLEPLGELSPEEAEQIFAEPISSAAAEADCILIETMCDATEAAAAVRAAKAHGGAIPVYCTLSFDRKGRLLTGTDIATAVAILEEAGADGVGCNCGMGPKQVVELLPQFQAAAHVPILMSPNAGMPEMKNGQACYNLTPAEFAEEMHILFEQGVWGLGGCCGTTPAHIRAMMERCHNLK